MHHGYKHHGYMYHGYIHHGYMHHGYIHHGYMHHILDTCMHALLVGNKADLVKMRRVKQGGGIFLTYCTGLEVNKVLQHFVSWANSSTQSILRHHQVSIVFSAIGFCYLH